jgi:hypothetical protein
MTKDMKTDAGTASSNPFGDLSAMLEQFKVPGVDMSSFIEARRKDVEALVEANKAAYEAMQALARTQADMLTRTMQSIQESAKGLPSGAAGVPDAAKLGVHRNEQPGFSGTSPFRVAWSAPRSSANSTRRHDPPERPAASDARYLAGGDLGTSSGFL